MLRSRRLALMLLSQQAPAPSSSVSMGSQRATRSSIDALGTCCVRRFLRRAEAIRWRRFAVELRATLWYIPPSIVFLLLRWPFEGIGGGFDLVFAGFPVLHALAWVCAHDTTPTANSAVRLVSAHLAFLPILLDDQFLSLRTD
jgi:hypothetical protein